MINLDNITYRFLTEEDFEIYIDHIKKIPPEKFQLIKKESVLQSLRKDKFVTDKEKVSAAFYNNELLMSLNGYFPSEIKSWYAGWNFSTFNEKSLNQHKIVHSVFANLIIHLQNFAEENHYFGYYTRRIISHQLAADKIYLQLRKENRRYEVFWDTIYQGPCVCTNKLHQFYKTEIENSIGTSVVTFCSLQNEFRKEILLKNNL